eukprot:CAMPEP_0181512604 /NCGR_PEP_ID=MMETSP1110-20121109/62059_1 /TAXON_ID=174948 /ORGANISM="Symbiodinium sp., Strain CCMP421" /LENGTH=160 /DNA_ID=CAMNT_0023642425 /DNA_START=66 /DNA_END=545 /DNA_ORIENTATION=-
MAYESNVTKFVRGTERVTIQNETHWRLDMKRLVLRKIWHFQPWIQHEVCQHVSALGLIRPFIGMLIRRGDKLDYRAAIPVDTFVSILKSTSLHSRVKQVFIATDDCSVLESLQGLAPEFVFKSLCSIQFGKGFVIGNLKVQSSKDIDLHYLKFFGELIVL